eukprot:gene730-1404_t
MITMESSGARIDDELSSAEDDNGQPPTNLKKKPEIVTKKPKSKYKGVFRCGKKFKAQIQTHGVQHYLGLFDSEDEAARAYDIHARNVLGARCKPNFEHDEIVKQMSATEPSSIQSRSTQPVAEALKVKGSHPRRTYVGIKARRKRQSEANDIIDNIRDASRGMQQPTHQQQQQQHLQQQQQSQQLSLHQDNQLQTFPTNLPPKKKTKLENDNHHNSSINTNNNNNINVNNMGMIISPDTTQHYVRQQPLVSQSDWRDQIYYWCGEFNYDNINCCLLWKGSWLGSFAGRPDPEEFAWSSNEFEYSSPRIDHNHNNINDGGGSGGVGGVHTDGLLHPVSGLYTGYYMMDNDGSGNLRKYLDKQYLVEFDVIKDTSPPRYSVVGRGESDFGPFVLSGSYNTASRILEMSRQYVSETDDRARMSIGELRQWRLHSSRTVTATTTATSQHMLSLSLPGLPPQLMQGLPPIHPMSMSMPMNVSVSMSAQGQTQRHRQGMMNATGPVMDNNISSSTSTMKQHQHQQPPLSCQSYSSSVASGNPSYNHNFHNILPAHAHALMNNNNNHVHTDADAAVSNSIPSHQHQPQPQPQMSMSMPMPMSISMSSQHASIMETGTGTGTGTGNGDETAAYRTMMSLSLSTSLDGLGHEI